MGGYYVDQSCDCGYTFPRKRIGTSMILQHLGGVDAIFQLQFLFRFVKTRIGERFLVHVKAQLVEALLHYQT